MNASNHDLRLSTWGPYTKRYAGISHIPDVQKGLRFDLSVFPGFYRRGVAVPSVMWESGYHPWEASPDFAYYSHRHDLEWKDRVYADISFSKIDDTSRLVRCECVNNSDDPQNIVLHLVASLHFPSADAYSVEPVRIIEPCMPQDCNWVAAPSYLELNFAHPRPSDNLVPDGLRRGEVRGHGFACGSGVGCGFGADRGDRVTYTFEIRHAIPEAEIVIRYRMPSKSTTQFLLKNLATGDSTTILLEGTGEFTSAVQSLGKIEKGMLTFALESLGGSAVELDILAILSVSNANEIRFKEKIWNPVPNVIHDPSGQSLLLKYDDTACWYGLSWNFGQSETRRFLGDELDILMRQTVQNHTSKVFKGKGSGCFEDVFLRPIPLAPVSRRIIYGCICSGPDQEYVKNRCLDFQTMSTAPEEIYNRSRLSYKAFSPSEQGAPYLFSQQRMAATILTNVVYPVYMKQGWIRNYTPGRCWDCLYTWDTGFIGVGLIELSIDRAVDCMNAYLTDPHDLHAAFIHHGSPVPVQFFLFQELWNRTGNRSLLESTYPKLQRYYRFLAGREGSSTCNTLKSNLLRTWDYFYNSGGWDDYPPQKHVHDKNLEAYVSPVITTSMVIRCAKILRMAAEILKTPSNATIIDQDLAEYTSDIDVFSNALHSHSWDKGSGYFGYVVHDTSGRPAGILRHDSNWNFNCGLDGAHPLISGICTDVQKTKIIENLTLPGRLWSKIGLSAVDQRAPYYRNDGYWNGAVWMPHQWFFWKALLDCALPDEAFTIAKTALDVWSREVDLSYNCFEHFMIESGRGAGWHQFGGLSAPVLSFFNAYYSPGHLTAGFDVWFENLQWSDDNRRCEVSVILDRDHTGPFTIIAAMDGGRTYRAVWNGTQPIMKELLPGVFAITIDSATPDGKLVVEES